eukprot:7570087-Pyramimonas_sp.AAC.1
MLVPRFPQPFRRCSVPRRRRLRKLARHEDGYGRGGPARRGGRPCGGRPPRVSAQPRAGRGKAAVRGPGSGAGGACGLRIHGGRRGGAP